MYKRQEHDSIKQIKTNPYILCTSGIDIDFRSVDRMAADLGFDAENSALSLIHI